MLARVSTVHSCLGISAIVGQKQNQCVVQLVAFTSASTSLPMFSSSSEVGKHGCCRRIADEFEANNVPISETSFRQHHRVDESRYVVKRRRKFPALGFQVSFDPRIAYDKGDQPELN